MISELTTADVTIKTSARSYRVLQVLDCSLPVVAGYTVRSRDIVNAQRSIGFQPTVVTGPLHELLDKTSSPIEIEGIRYLRTPLKGFRGNLVRRGLPILSQASFVQLLKQRILQILDQEKFDLIHAHSPVLCGMAALQAASKRNLPFVYEIRAFWEDAAVDQKKTTEKSLRYRGTRALEQHVVSNANAVVGIAQSILTELQSRGLPKDKLFHVPNGVDINKFQPGTRDEALASQLGLGKEPVFGFIGTFFRFEGVKWLVEAAAELRKRGHNFRLLIVGDGEDGPDVRAAVQQANASDWIILTGKVPPDKVRNYYSVMDVLVYPRVSIRLTELVTPLKPLEAMAQERAVLASDVGGLRELVQHESTGLLFKPGDKDDFCRQAVRLMESSFRSDLAKAGRDSAVQNKNWISIAKRYDNVYQTAIASKGKR